MSPSAGPDAVIDPQRADVGNMPERSRQLPAVWLVLACFGVSLLAGAAAARAVVVGLAQQVGTVAALPAGVLTFVVVSALALVLTARVDHALSR